MALELLKSNLIKEKKAIEDLIVLSEQLEHASEAEKSFFENASFSLLNQIAIMNNSVPKLLEGIRTAKELPGITTLSAREKEEKIEIERIASEGTTIAIKPQYKKRFLKELQISKKALKALKKTEIEKPKKKKDKFKKPSRYAILSSSIFSNLAFKMAESEFFKGINRSLRKANMPYLLSTYLSVTLFTTLVVFLIALFVAIFSSIFAFGGETFIAIQIDTAQKIAINFFIAILIPIITFTFFLIYPSVQASSIKGKVNNELPFAIIHMSSIAGSGVEPTKIFRIIAASKEYPAVGKELMKLVNRVNLYGYDLSTALKLTAKATSSGKLASLFNGIATNLSGGGSLTSYLDKRAEDMLLEYKLERKKYVNSAETAMDIYTGILIAAPLIFMVMLIMMNAIGMDLGLSMQTLSFLIVVGLAVINIAFIVFLQLRQPE